VEQRSRYFSRSRREAIYEATCANARSPVGFRTAIYD
jgi:hypothetical protein